MTPYSLISEYYGRIDADDIDWVMQLFAEESCYMRADAEYKGKAEIENFFQKYTQDSRCT